MGNHNSTMDLAIFQPNGNMAFDLNGTLVVCKVDQVLTLPECPIIQYDIADTTTAWRFILVRTTGIEHMCTLTAMFILATRSQPEWEQGKHLVTDARWARITMVTWCINRLVTTVFLMSV